MQHGATLNGTGRVIGTITAQAGSFVAPGHSPGKLIIDGNDTQQPGSTLALEINGTTPGTNQDQIEVTGSNRVVTLTGSTLSVTTESKLPNGADITIINNVSSTSTVVGTFTDLPEGGTIVVGTIVVGTSGADITYQGGTGNDVVLHVNIDWIGLPDHTDLDGPGPALTLGCDAFVTLAEATAFVTDKGTITIYPDTDSGDAAT